MNIKYYKENKAGEEKVLRIDMDKFQTHPQKKEEKVYEVMFVKHSTDGLSPIVSPGFLPGTAMKEGNPFGFEITEITRQEFELYVTKAVDQLWNIINTKEDTKTPVDETSTSQVN